MALFIRQNEDRSKLQERLAAELQEKAKKRTEAEGKSWDGVEDANYLKDTKPTTSLAWLWIVIVLAVVGAMVFVVVVSNS